MAVVPAFAFGPEGHRTIGAIADRLLADTNAGAQVEVILGGLSLQEAGVWADCAKGVDPTRGFAYTAAGRYPECKVFETGPLEAEMSDFVRRNDTNCARRRTDESCHKRYHYTDVAIQRSHYAARYVGARDDDVVAALMAAIRVLRGEPAAPPFAIGNSREALLLLAHLVGDIHQPLHVGAVYLDPQGRRIDPDVGGADTSNDTRGGNRIMALATVRDSPAESLHHLWDALPATQTVRHVDAGWIEQARAVAPTGGEMLSWPSTWANETLLEARRAYRGLRFSQSDHGDWTVVLPRSYADTMNTVKRKQLIEAGARLAQVLRAVWP
jgi:hypothetical protein